MTSTPQPPNADPSRIEYWILALVTAADDDERLHVGVEACAAGHSQSRVQCTRCPRTHGASLPVPFVSMVRHVRAVEIAYRDIGAGDGPNAAAHRYADIVPAPLTRFEHHA